MSDHENFLFVIIQTEHVTLVDAHDEFGFGIRFFALPWLNARLSVGIQPANAAIDPVFFPFHLENVNMVIASALVRFLVWNFLPVFDESTMLYQNLRFLIPRRNPNAADLPSLMIFHLS